MKEVILVTGKDCHLCEQAKDLLNELQEDQLIFIEKDVYSKRDYLDKYWDKIPVILFKDLELLWPFNQENIKDLLL
ncbi:MAG: glutaredoxin family protein [Gammaproteobacteria bacterium]